MQKHHYMPATALVDMAAVDAVAQIQAIHRDLFGGWRMEAEDEDGEPVDQEETGYPDGTPIREMTIEQQAAYWKAMSRKHEDAAKARGDYDAIKAERDQYKQASMTDAEKAIEDARAAADAAARADERVKLTGQIAAARLHGALAAKGLNDAQITAIVAPLNPNHFLADTGEVDTAKVTSYVDSLGVGANRQWPDMGQGKRGSGEPAKSVGAGRDLYRDKHAKK